MKLLSSNINYPKSLNIFYNTNYTLFPLLYNIIINTSGGLIEQEDSDDNNFPFYLNTSNKLTIFFLFHKDFIKLDLLFKYIETYFLEALKSYCIDVCKEFYKVYFKRENDNINNFSLEELINEQNYFKNIENKAKYKFFFLSKSEIKLRIEKFTNKTLENIKIIEYENLYDLNFKLLNIPLIHKDSFSNLGLIIIDSANIHENILINITDEKSILNPLYYRNRKPNKNSNMKKNQKSNNRGKKTACDSKIFMHIYQMLYFHQKQLGFSLVNLIWDYDRISFLNQINYNRLRNRMNFEQFEKNNSLNANFDYITNFNYLLYKLPKKPLIGIQLIPIESLISQTECCGVFGIAFMSDKNKMSFTVFKFKKDLVIFPIKNSNYEIIDKNANNKKNNYSFNNTNMDESIINESF